MALSANRLLTVLLCLLLLSHQQKVYGLKGISLAFGREEDEVPEKKPRVLAQSNAANLNNNGGYSASPSSADPNRMSERRVRRGSDPIHNRLLYFLKSLFLSLGIKELIRII
uniref:Uncharacterized protein n=1 Tax=Oryza glaberrima TaxID=4538 RepID=I1QIZ3_ORYGL